MAATVTNILAALKQVDPEAFANAGAPSVTAPTKTTIELPKEILETLEEFDAAKELAKYADGQKELAEQKIRDALNGADIGLVDGKPVVKVNASHNGHYNGALLKSAFPEAAEATYVRVDYTYLTTVK